jgi:hypothetical protein
VGVSLKKWHEFHTVDARRCPMDLSRHHFVAQAPFDARYRRHVAAVDFAVGRVLVIWFGLLSKTPAQAETPPPARFDLAASRTSVVVGWMLWMSALSFRMPPWALTWQGRPR